MKKSKRTSSCLSLACWGWTLGVCDLWLLWQQHAVTRQSCDLLKSSHTLADGGRTNPLELSLHANISACDMCSVPYISHLTKWQMQFCNCCYLLKNKNTPLSLPNAKDPKIAVFTFALLPFGPKAYTNNSCILPLPFLAADSNRDKAQTVTDGRAIPHPAMSLISLSERHEVKDTSPKPSIRSNSSGRITRSTE